jgi:hypothetical protein
MEKDELINSETFLALLKRLFPGGWLGDENQWEQREKYLGYLLPPYFGKSVTAEIGMDNAPDVFDVTLLSLDENENPREIVRALAVDAVEQATGMIVEYEMFQDEDTETACIYIEMTLRRPTDELREKQTARNHEDEKLLMSDMAIAYQISLDRENNKKQYDYGKEWKIKD